MRFTAKIIDGKIVWHNNKALNEHLNLIEGNEDIWQVLSQEFIRRT